MTTTRIDGFNQWFSHNSVDVPGGRYSHFLVIEDISRRPEVMDQLRQYVSEAHEPALISLRKPFETSLSPVEQHPPFDPAEGYPHLLDDVTLQGYLGEILAGTIAEHLPSIDSSQWEVPAFLFHTHDLAFQEIERIRQTGEASRRIFGRTGDDCLAFERNQEGIVQKVMCCEAKLTTRHSAQLIRENHEKLSAGLPRPVHIARVIDALKLLGEENRYATSWIESLQRYFFESGTAQRIDMSSYACGRRPRQRESWISREEPHEAYSANRLLIAVEIHLEDVSDLVQEAYRLEEDC